VEQEVQNNQENQSDRQEAQKSRFRGFYGNHHHSLDAKNRAFAPAKFKDHLTSGFVLTKGLDNCIFGYRLDEWFKLADNLCEIPFTDGDGRAFNRNFLGNAEDCDIDRQGRFSIPQNLREYAKLTKDISFVGMMDHFEIWDSARWKEANVIYDFSAEERAEKMQKYLKPSKPVDAV
jgi:MraZ protein